MDSNIFIAKEHIGKTVNGFTIPDQLKVSSNRGVGNLAARMGIYLVQMSPEKAIALMPLEGNEQTVGLMHGGAYCVLGETIGSIMANFHARTIDESSYAVGIDINATHSASMNRGWVTARAEAIRLGKKLTFHQINIEDENKRRLSTVRITNIILSGR